MNQRTFISVLVFVILIGLAYGCEEDQRPSRGKITFDSKSKTDTNNIEKQVTHTTIHDGDKYSISAEQFSNFNMKLGKVNRNKIQESISAAGYLEVPHEGMAEVRTFLGGYLRSTKLLPGNYVRKGQRLISLQNLEYIELQQEFLIAKEELKYAESVYQRKKTLADENISSLTSKQEAENEYFSALAKYEGLRKKIQLINIDPDEVKPGNITSVINLYSPISGFITRVNAIKGMYAEPTDVIFELINTNHLHLELKVYEKDIFKVMEKQKVIFHIPETNSGKFYGEVYLVAKTIDEDDRTVLVHCHIDEGQELPYIVGMYIEAEIIYNSYESFCLPIDSFVKEDGDYFVFIVDTRTDEDYVFKKTRVEIGNIYEDCVEVDEASRHLLDEKEVLITGAYDL